MQDFDFAFANEQSDEIPYDARINQYHTNEVLYQPSDEFGNEEGKIKEKEKDCNQRQDRNVNLFKKDSKNEFSSTGAYDEYTAAKEKEAPWFFDELCVKRKRKKRSVTIWH